MKTFNSFGAFAAHLAKLAETGPAVMHHALDLSAAEIQKTARGMIGDYQPAVGPFPAWEELADSTQAERARLGFSENDPGFRTGDMQASIQKIVDGHTAAIGSNDQHLVWFDQGTTNQPPRPVFGPAAIHSKHRVESLIGRSIFAWLAGRGWRRPSIASAGSR
ncbi:putative bacteriophage-related protein [Ralstonia solanacearum CMR15]|nr:putative bacteriophage-related protein [Ralstonia solanacearum CMR15]